MRLFESHRFFVEPGKISVCLWHWCPMVLFTCTSRILLRLLSLRALAQTFQANVSTAPSTRFVWEFQRNLDPIPSKSIPGALRIRVKFSAPPPPPRPRFPPPVVTGWGLGYGNLGVKGASGCYLVGVVMNDIKITKQPIIGFMRIVPEPSHALPLHQMQLHASCIQARGRSSAFCHSICKLVPIARDACAPAT